MSGSFAGSADGLGAGARRLGAEMWEAMEQARTSFEQRVAPRRGRGDVRAAVLALLAEQPMHGYQIIREIEDRSEGAWKPSAGSVYPTLQLLADEGMITAEEESGRKIYALTEAGRAEAKAAGEKTPPWADAGRHDLRATAAVPKAGMELAQVAMQVTREGTSEQRDRAVAVLDEARRKLHAILAHE